MTGSCVAAIDIGGTKALIGLVDRTGRVLGRRRYALGEERAPRQVVDHAVRHVHSLVTEAGLEWGAVRGLGCSVACMLDLPGDFVLRTPNIWQPLNVPLRAMLRQASGVPVWLEMDANAAALGEAWLGAGAEAQELVYVVVGTGIGAGILLDGKVYRGWGGTAGEVGHMIVEPDGPVCGCGKHGCLEALASGSAMARAAHAAISAGRQTSLSTATAIDAVAVLQAARRGDTLAQDIVQRSARYLGIGLTSLIHLLNPQVIVLGGGVIQGGADLMLESMRQTIAERCGDWVDLAAMHIMLSALGEDAAMLGAARQVWNELGVSC